MINVNDKIQLSGMNVLAFEQGYICYQESSEGGVDFTVFDEQLNHLDGGIIEDEEITYRDLINEVNDLYIVKNKFDENLFIQIKSRELIEEIFDLF